MARKLPEKNFKWTPELAYVVGLLVTDGNLSSDGRHISMRSSEKEQLKTFKKCLGINNIIGCTPNNGFSQKPCYRVQLGNVQLHRWLSDIGVKPAKTYSIGPVKLPKMFFKDFLRGHLDGDGCIQTYEDTYNVYKNKRYSNTRIYTRFLSASEKHATWLLDMIRGCITVEGALLFKKSFKENRVPMWEVRFSKYDSLKIFKWIYYNERVPCLKRKRDLADKLLAGVKNKKLVRLA